MIKTDFFLTDKSVYKKTDFKTLEKKWKNHINVEQAQLSFSVTQSDSFSFFIFQDELLSAFYKKAVCERFLVESS